jgi:hypothetical protein
MIPCNRRLPDDDISVPKHVEVNTYHELSYMICILWYFFEHICWLIYGRKENA